MTRLRHNIIANFSGQVVVSAVQLLMIPIYVRHLGVEAYGLVAFQLTLQAIFQVLDLGLSPTVNRELARYSTHRTAAGAARDFVRTLEAGYWAIGVLLAAAVYGAAPIIAGRWLHRSALAETTVVESLRTIAVLIAVQWPLTFYQGGLLGLQRHGRLNAIRVGMILFTSAGAYVVVTSTSTPIVPFFRWLAAASLVHVLLLALALWRALPRAASGAARLRWSAVAGVWRFAAGMTAITVTALVLTQVDRVVLSRLVSLESFGYYALGGVLGHGLYAVISPMFASLFPRFSALVALNDTRAVEALYRRAWQLISALVVPAAAVIAVFSRDVILVWTGSAVIAGAAGPIATLLVIGTALNGLMNVPYALQLANGWTRIAVRINVFLASCSVPAVLVLTDRYGLVGAAAVWPALNACYLVLALPPTHRRLAAFTGRGWLGRDIALPAAAAVGVALLCRTVLPGTSSTGVIVAEVTLSWMASEAALVLLTSELRLAVKDHLVSGVAVVRRHAAGVEASS